MSSLEFFSSLDDPVLGLLERAPCSKAVVNLYHLEMFLFCDVTGMAQGVALAASLAIAQLKSGGCRRMTTEIWTWFFIVTWRKELHRLY